MTRRFAGVIRMDVGNGEHTTWPDPLSPQVRDAAYRARYHMAELTQTDCFHLATCANVMAHLLGGDYPIKWVIDNLRKLRKAIRDIDCEPATPAARKGKP